MGLFDKLIGSSEDRANYREAKTELEETSRRDRDQSDATVAANDRVVAAERRLPRWRQYRG
ncbi:hypothetical protein ADL21_06325 [Streptomyces albus subsp. albus]|nr:hypothetical protein ADL21_06325 [Streptomyces albus subsp. albus]